MIRRLPLCIYSSTILLLLSFQVQSGASKIYRTFWHPLYLGERLNYCTFKTSQCGISVAHSYCKMLGYDYGTGSRIAYNVGRTNYLDFRAHCIGWQCNGFMNISCAQLAHNSNKSYAFREKKFVYPRFNNFRLDWCADYPKGCGREVATSFCKYMGYMKAKKFKKESQVGATQSMKDNKLCFGKKCEGFEYIICYR